MDCKSMYTGSIPVGTSIATLQCSRALSSAGERFLDVEEVTGSIPVAPTSENASVLLGFRCLGVDECASDMHSTPQ